MSIRHESRMQRAEMTEVIATDVAKRLRFETSVAPTDASKRHGWSKSEIVRFSTHLVAASCVASFHGNCCAKLPCWKTKPHQ